MASINNFVSSALDFSGLRSLSSASNQTEQNRDEINKKVAAEFESMFLKQLTDSMQAALEPFESGLVSNDSTKLFQGLFYDEVAHIVPKKQSLGIYEWLNSLDQRGRLVSTSETE
jgi:Rod binding domain-containing protein